MVKALYARTGVRKPIMVGQVVTRSDREEYVGKKDVGARKKSKARGFDHGRAERACLGGVLSASRCTAFKKASSPTGERSRCPSDNNLMTSTGCHFEKIKVLLREAAWQLVEAIEELRKVASHKSELNESQQLPA